MNPDTITFALLCLAFVAVTAWAVFKEDEP